MKATAVIVNNKQVGYLVPAVANKFKEHVQTSTHRLIYLLVPGRGGKLKQVMQWVSNKNWRYPVKKDRVVGVSW